ncbi:hypothetical protein [Lentzea xinjiangensis]|uniref:hypothetical protein n=1 Tax=Lentzea xinjiangensis TaxID=402600 RepID=UPI000B7F8D51|nr:hypothetical protein [Lentzea xinjiangensis]
MIITAVLAVLVLIGGGVTAAVVLKSAGEEEEAAAEPAEARVVAQKTEPEPVRYGDVAVVDACTAMPVALLEELGFRDAAHGWHSQRYLTRSVPVAAATVKDETDALSSCLYEPLNEEAITRITLSVKQVPFNDLYRVDGPRRDETALNVAGIRVFVSPDEKPDSFNARIVASDGKVQAHLGISRMADNKEISDYRATFDELARRVAENVAKGPRGRTTHVHTGRYEGVPNACDVLSSELFEEITRGEDSGVAEADYYEPEAYDRFENDKGEVSHFYSSKQECRRLSPEWFGRERGDGKGLKIHLTTYRDAGMAVRDAQDCNPQAPSRRITGDAVMSEEKIGDFAACGFLVGDSPTISFVAGRTQARLTGYGDWAPGDPGAYVREFTPVARKVADEVREAIG